MTTKRCFIHSTFISTWIFVISSNGVDVSQTSQLDCIVTQSFFFNLHSALDISFLHLDINSCFRTKIWWLALRQQVLLYSLLIGKLNAVAVSCLSTTLFVLLFKIWSCPNFPPCGFGYLSNLSLNSFVLISFNCTYYNGYRTSKLSNLLPLIMRSSLMTSFLKQCHPLSGKFSYHKIYPFTQSYITTLLF